MIRYDYSFMVDDSLHDKAISLDRIAALTDSVKQIRQQQFIDQRYGFIDILSDQEAINQVSELADHCKQNFTTLLVLGIGGSDLGARSAISALLGPYFNFVDSQRPAMKVFFLGANTDPDEIESVLAAIDLKQTVVNVISKSGDTIETMSTFLYIRDLLIKEVGNEQHKLQVIATTDQSKGTLRSIADQEGYATLTVPETVGGRFSVLSTVGLFPIACAGIEITELVRGGLEYYQALVESRELSGAELYALCHYLGYVDKGYDIHVLLPYAAFLREMGFWYRQLWAESLGKKETLKGEIVNVGPTPIAALGATDQHSQFQLYYFGSFNKIVTFVEVEKFKSQITVPSSLNHAGVNYMNDLNFNQILNAELKASSLALAERERVNGRLILPELNEYYLGQLYLFLEIATVYVAALFEINAFDQPGVELGKQNMFALLGRPDYEQRKTELMELNTIYGSRIV